MRVNRRGFVAAGAASVLGLVGCRWPAGLTQRSAPKSFARWLGLLPNTRFLIVHADDVGIARSANRATIKAFESGAIDSASIMVPCPGFKEFGAWAAAHPDADLGVHLTLTSQPLMRWGPITDAARVPSLVDADGMFPVAWKPGRYVRQSELAMELRAQISAAKLSGVELTHLDAHQHLLQLRGAEVYGVFERVAREERLPFRFARSWQQRAPYAFPSVEDSTMVLEQMIAISPNNAAPEEWNQWYSHQVSQIPSGLNELFVHLGFDDDEMRAVVPNNAPWGAAWRERDMAVVLGGKLSNTILEHGIVRTGWRQVRNYLRIS